MTVSVVSVSVVWDISLSGSVKTLGDGVQASAGAEGDTGVGIRISITSVDHSGISLGLSLSVSLSIGHRSVRITSISQRSSGTRDGLIGSIHTGSRLPSEGMETIGVGVAIASVEQGWVSLSHDSSNKGTSSNKESHG